MTIPDYNNKKARGIASRFFIRDYRTTHKNPCCPRKPEKLAENMRPRHTGDRPRCTGDRPLCLGDRPRLRGGYPRYAGDHPRNVKDHPRHTGNRPRHRGDWLR